MAASSGGERRAEYDNIVTVHSAIGDYLGDEPRHMRRSQVMATLAISDTVRRMTT